MKQLNTDNTKDKNKSFRFSAINRETVSNIVPDIELQQTNNGFVFWGEDNDYPNYLYRLYETATPLHSCVTSLVDYICGDSVDSDIDGLDKKVRCIALQYVLYGCFAINVLRNRFGDVVDIVPVDIRCLRSNKDNTEFFYSENFREIRKWQRYKCLKYSVYNPDSREIASSIYFYKNSLFKTYGDPIYKSALLSAEVQSSINEYNLNSLNNGITSNVILNFNNGVPDEEQQSEIEDLVYEKFSSFRNASRPMINFSDDSEHSLTVERIDVDDFVERYGALAKRSADEVYSAFRMSPMLAGITLDNQGFAEQNFEDAYRLFNKTVVQPLQKDIVNGINNLLGDGAVSITPFNLKWEDTADDNNQNVNEIN